MFPPPQTNTQRRRFSGMALLVIALVLLQMILLTYRLADQSMWTDEGYSAFLTHLNTPAEALDQAQRIERRPPLQFMSLWLWSQDVGQSDLSLRYLSVMCMVMATALIYQLSKRVFSEHAGLWAALLIVTSPTLLLYGRMIRGYAMTLTLGLASTLAFWNAWQRRRAIDWLAYLVCSTLLVLSNYPALAILVAHAVYTATQWKYIRVHWQQFLFPAIGLAAVLGLFWVTLKWQASPVNIQGFSSPFDFLADTPLSTYVRRIPNMLAGSLYLLYSFTFGETIFPWHPLVWVGAAGIFVWLWRNAQYYRQPRRGQQFAMLLLIATFTLVCLVLCGLLFTGNTLVVIAARGLFIAPLFYMALSPYGEDHSSQTRRIVLTAILAVRGIAILSGFADPGAVFNSVYAVPVRELALHIARNVQAEDAVIFEEPLPFDLYFRQLGTNTPLFTPGRRHYGYTIGPEIAPDSPAFLGQGGPSVAALRPSASAPISNPIPPARLWLAVFHAEGTERTVETEIAQPLAQAGLYQLASRTGYARQDPLYARLRAWRTSRTPIEYKAEIVLYTRTR